MSYYINGAKIPDNCWLLMPNKMNWKQKQSPEISGISANSSQISYSSEKDRIRERTFDQTVSEDGGVRSPVDDKIYTNRKDWNNHIKQHDLIATK